MKPRFCYWSVVDGDYALMARVMVKSARQAGVGTDFHIWTDRPIAGAKCHRAGSFKKGGCFFKLNFMRDEIRKFKYDYYVWLDTDTYFVRDPGDILRVLHGSPVHLTLECDLGSPKNRRLEWWHCPNQKLMRLMRDQGVASDRIFNCNGGFWIVHHDVIETVFDLAFDFFHYCEAKGFLFVDEPLLAYAMHRLCPNPEAHTLRATKDVWASDWTGRYRDVLPDGRRWRYKDYFTEEQFLINPAIVHCMRSKQALIAESLSRDCAIARGVSPHLSPLPVK